MEGLVMNNQFWINKKVLITGHTGFKGSWLSLWLQQMGAEVIGYSLNQYSNKCLFDIADVGKGMINVFDDIRNLDKLKKCLITHRPEIVIHMAAQSLVRYGYKNPVDTFTTNVIGTVNLLEAVRYTEGVKVVIIVTSDKCYKNSDSIWYHSENEPMGGFDPYSSSKGCAELVSSAYRSSFFNANEYNNHGVGLATVRAGNVIGGGDWAKDRLIPDALEAFTNGQILKIRNPQAVRPWQHVMEPLRGYLMLAEMIFKSGSQYSEAWNFGPTENDSKSVQWIANKLCQLWEMNADWEVESGIKHPHESQYLNLDITKARKQLKWHPIINLNDALELVVEWAKNYNADHNMRNFTLSQLSNYQTLMKQHAINSDI